MTALPDIALCGQRLRQPLFDRDPCLSDLTGRRRRRDPMRANNRNPAPAKAPVARATGPRLATA